MIYQNEIKHFVCHKMPIRLITKKIVKFNELSRHRRPQQTERRKPHPVITEALLLAMDKGQS